MPLIEARGLTKKFRQAVKEPGLAGSLKHFFTRQYRDKMAVDHIDLSIEAGESVAYLGPNGAGKSTTIKMLTGILVPTEGSLIVDGLVPYERRQQNALNIGVVFGQRTQLWWDIPVVESFNLARDMYEIPPKRYKENLGQFTELLGLNEFMNIPAGKISLGQRMRADLCMALLHDPKLLYLDEPTIGLDIAVKDSIRKFIRTQVEEHGTTAKGEYDRSKFRYRGHSDSYRCPAGQVLRKTGTIEVNGRLYERYENARACAGCPHRGRCTRGSHRRVFRDQNEEVRERMRGKLEGKRAHRRYNKRAHAAESPYGNVKWNLKFRAVSAEGGRRY